MLRLAPTFLCAALTALEQRKGHTRWCWSICHFIPATVLHNTCVDCGCGAAALSLLRKMLHVARGRNSILGSLATRTGAKHSHKYCICADACMCDDEGEVATDHLMHNKSAGAAGPCRLLPQAPGQQQVVQVWRKQPAPTHA